MRPPAIGPSSRPIAAQRAVCSQSFLFDSGHDLVDAHAEIIVEHKHLAARDEAIIHEHARRSGFPANKITEVRRMIDPTTATES